jgi:hypothetical protein
MPTRRTPSSSALAEHDQQQLARLVHGQIQARIIGTALLLEQTAREGRREPRRRARPTARRLPPERSSRPYPGRARATRRARDGVGIAADVDLDLAPDVTARLDADRTASEAIVAVVGEALTNAVRHGGASSVRVRVAWEPMTSEMLVVVDDDGRLDERGSPGLGSQLFHEHTRWWTLTPGDGGTRLAARIALRARSVRMG